MMKTPQVPPQELDPGSITLRLQLPGSSKGETRSSLGLSSRGSEHLSAGAGPKGLVPESHLSYSWLVLGGGGRGTLHWGARPMPFL